MPIRIDVTFPAPPDDTPRVDALRALRILDTPAEPAFDDIAELASALCSTPMASVTLVDADRQWAKAVVGLPHADAPREHAFCSQTILTPSGCLEVRDTHAAAEWAQNPLVTGRPWLRHYAGAAIVTPEGHAIGTVSVADHQPGRLSPRALTGLAALARQTAALLELRRQTGRLVQANAELHRHALEDPLTGLANRTILHDRLAQALRLRTRTEEDLGVVAGDLDAFRAVNERLGHEMGDELLRIVARRMASVARGSDTLSRIAGDEFVLVCPGLGAAPEIDLVRTRLRAAVEQPVTLRGTSFVPRLSMGAVVAEAGEDAGSVLRRADAAMHAAKRAAFA